MNSEKEKKTPLSELIYGYDACGSPIADLLRELEAYRKKEYPMSDTPRTNALRAKHKSGVGNSFYGEMHQHAETLERELFQRDSRIAELVTERDEHMRLTVAERERMDTLVESLERRLSLADQRIGYLNETVRQLLHTIDHPADAESAVALERELGIIERARAALDAILAGDKANE